MSPFGSDAPAGSAAGIGPVNVTTGPARSTSNVKVNGSDMLVTASDATSTSLWLPPAIPSGSANGDVHGAAAPPSSAQVNVAVSSAVKAIGSDAHALVRAATATFGGVPSTVKVTIAATPVLPARSVARTAAACLPSASVNAVWALVPAPQDTNAAPSTLHSKRATLSPDMNPSWNGRPTVAPSLGAAIATVGLVRSTVQRASGGEASRAPPGAIARTMNTCAPSASPLSACGDVQAANAAPSRLHSNVAVARLAVNAIVAAPLFATTPGFCVIVVTGRGPLTAHWYVAGLESRCPPATARTANVCEPSARPLSMSGVAQLANAALSRLHSKVAPAALAANANVT